MKYDRKERGSSFSNLDVEVVQSKFIQVKSVKYITTRTYLINVDLTKIPRRILLLSRDIKFDGRNPISTHK